MRQISFVWWERKDRSVNTAENGHDEKLKRFSIAIMNSCFVENESLILR